MLVCRFDATGGHTRSHSQSLRGFLRVSSALQHRFIQVIPKVSEGFFVSHLLYSIDLSEYQELTRRRRRGAGGCIAGVGANVACRRGPAPAQDGGVSEAAETTSGAAAAAAAAETITTTPTTTTTARNAGGCHQKVIYRH